MKRTHTFLWLGTWFFIERVFLIHFFPAVFYITLSNNVGIRIIWSALIFGIIYDIISTLPFGFYSISLVTATLFEVWILSRLYEHRRSSRIIGATIGVGAYTLVRFVEFSFLHRQDIMRQLTQELVLQILIVWVVIGVLEKFVYSRN